LIPLITIVKHGLLISSLKKGEIVNVNSIKWQLWL